MLWRPFCQPFCVHVTDMSEINFNMLNRFLELKNLCLATKIMCLAHILMKLLRILSFGGHLGRHLEYFNFPNDAEAASFPNDAEVASVSFNERTWCRTHLCKNILCGLFLGCIKNLHLATSLSSLIDSAFRETRGNSILVQRLTTMDDLIEEVPTELPEPARPKAVVLSRTRFPALKPKLCGQDQPASQPPRRPAPAKKTPTLPPQPPRETKTLMFIGGW